MGTSHTHLGRARGRASRAAPIITVILLALAAALLVAGCSVDVGGDKGGQAAVGEPAANDKVAVTVHSVTTYSKITTEEGDVLAMTSPKNVYLIVDLTVRNLQDTAFRIDPGDVHLVKSDDKYWAGDTGQWSSDFPDEFKALEADSLAAGKQVRGMVAYGVPKGTELKSVTYVTDPDIVIALDGMTVKAPPVKRAPKVAGTAKGGGLAFTVSSVTYPDSLTDGVWTTSAKSGNRLVLVKATVRNVDRKPPYKVDPLAIAIVDASGDRWGPFNRSDLGLSDTEQFPMKRLRAGAKTSGKVVISVPKSAKLMTVRYEVGVLGPPVEVRITH
jgi:hypothetical protein